MGAEASRAGAPGKDAGEGWRPMVAADLPVAEALATATYPGHPEDEAVLLERFRLFPEGCLAFGPVGAGWGYAVSHPWTFRSPPALNTLLGALPADPDTLHLHDLALLPSARGRNATAGALGRLSRVAAGLGLQRICLVAIGGLAPFWAKHGFVVVEDPCLLPVLRRYDPAALLMEKSVAQDCALE
ncbi:GNAT family N-acetyltransferase [Muricoccus radiodurans]|uniref:GNAT family N-acetyltransferase n=1 Tax=Muricoccus radiodurans TaxID=2231721 RepID=UPI003CEC4515